MIRLTTLSVLLLLLSLVFVFVSAQPSVQPSAVFHDANAVLPMRLYSGCGWDVHAVGRHSSTPLMFQMGGLTGPPNYYENPPTIDISTTGSWLGVGFNTITPTFNFNTSGLYGTGTPMVRLAPGCGVTSNGTMVIASGKAGSNYVQGNDVIYSTDQGNSWWLATLNASFQPRADHVFAVQPNTNVMVLAAGAPPSGPALNDVWASFDGVGATWTLQTLHAPWPVFTEGGLIFLYDRNTSIANSNSTLILYNPGNAQIYQSLDCGITWSSIHTFSTTYGGGSRLTADAENYLYLFGLNLNQLIFSADKGTTWTQLSEPDNYPNVYNLFILTYFTNGCIAPRYVAAASAPNGYHKQMILYGDLSISIDTPTAFSCAEPWSNYSSYTNALCDLVFAGETVAPYETEVIAPPTTVSTPSLAFHDASTALPARGYQTCAYDVQAAITKTAPRMWSIGGFTSSYSYINSLDYTQNGFQSFTTTTPWYSAGTGAPTISPGGRVAGGTGCLHNGNLLMFGGKLNSAGSGSNDVWYSVNNGFNWTLSLLNAPWWARTDLASAALPGTNIVVLVGGANATSGTAMNDVWYSSDGQGASWTLATAAGPFPSFVDAAFVALYDSSAVSSSYTQANNSLIVMVNNQDAIYKSTTLGRTWQLLSFAPWLVRQRAQFTTDMELYIYMSGGLDTSSNALITGEVWWSWNGGLNWAELNQASLSSLYGERTVSLQTAHDNCFFMRYIPMTGSPGGYHKQLIVFGAMSGAITVLSARNGPGCATTTSVSLVSGDLFFPSELNNLAAFASSNVPTLAINSASSSGVTYRQYPACANDVHAVMNRSTTAMSYAISGLNNGGTILTSLDQITGVSTSSVSVVTYTGGLGGRVAAGVAVLVNGELMLLGGKDNTPTYYNDVWVSGNQGSSFSRTLANAPFSPRSDVSLAALPGTKCVILVGGATSAGYIADTWSSCDGSGAVWTQGTAPFTANQDGGLVALYDGQAAGGTQANSTVLYYDEQNQAVWSSTNLGTTWSITSAAVPWSARGYARFTADLEGFVYLTSSANDIWASPDKGFTWSIVNQLTITQAAGLGYSQVYALNTAQSSCTTLHYTSVNTGNCYGKQLFIYAGVMSLTSGLTATAAAALNPLALPTCQACAAATTYTSSLADILQSASTYLQVNATSNCSSPPATVRSSSSSSSLSAAISSSSAPSTGASGARTSTTGTSGSNTVSPTTTPTNMSSSSTIFGSSGSSSGSSGIFLSAATSTCTATTAVTAVLLLATSLIMMLL